MAILYKSDIERVNSCAEAALSSEVSDTDTIINNINDQIIKLFILTLNSLFIITSPTYNSL